MAQKKIPRKKIEAWVQDYFRVEKKRFTNFSRDK